MSGKSPIFVFCQHRTGSTLLRNMLNLHSRVAMTVDEMVVLNPWQRTLFDVLAKYDLTTDSGLRSGLEALYACEAYGAFWRYFDREKMPLEAIFDQVRTTEATAWGVVDAFLEFTRRTQGKERAGAKNFAHFRYFSDVIERYPDAKCIFLVRDPFAMCASKLKSPGTRGRKADHPVLAPGIHLVILLFFLFEFRRTARAIFQYKKRYPILVVRYEDLVHSPVEAVRRVCEFCELPFEDAMLSASGKESSHTGISVRGVDPARASSGIKTLRPWERRLVSLMTARARTAFGYGESQSTAVTTNEGPGYLKGF